MSLEYTISANPEQIADVISLFEFIGGNTDEAMRVAINKAAPKVRTAASSAIREQVRLKAAYVRDRLTIRRATRRNLSGAISTPTRGILLSRFSTDTMIADTSISWISAPKVSSTGVRVKVKPTGTASTLSGHPEIDGKPFYLVLRNSRALAIAGRRKTSGPQGGKFKVFYGPSVSQVFNTVRDDVLPQASAEFQAQLLDAMRYILVKKYPPEPIEE